MIGMQTAEVHIKRCLIIVEMKFFYGEKNGKRLYSIFSGWKR